MPSPDDAIGAYATLLEDGSTYFKKASSLPLPKATLKAALITEARDAVRRGLREYARVLRTGYCMLADFVSDEVFERNLDLTDLKGDDLRRAADEMAELIREFDRQVGPLPVVRPGS